MFDFNEVGPGRSTSMWHGKHSSCNCQTLPIDFLDGSRTQSAEAVTQSRNAHPGTGSGDDLLVTQWRHTPKKPNKGTGGRCCTLSLIWIGHFSISFEFCCICDSCIDYPHPLCVHFPIYQRSNPNISHSCASENSQLGDWNSNCW